MTEAFHRQGAHGGAMSLALIQRRPSDRRGLTPDIPAPARSRSLVVRDAQRAHFHETRLTTFVVARGDFDDAGPSRRPRLEAHGEMERDGRRVGPLATTRVSSMGSMAFCPTRLRVLPATAL